MVGESQKQTRTVIKLSTVQINKTDKKYLSMVSCNMKDLKVNDIFFLLDPDQSLVLDKDGNFLYIAESIPKQHKDTYMVKVRELK